MKTVVKRIILLVVAFVLEGVLGALLINGIENHNLANSKIAKKDLYAITLPCS